LIFQAGGVARRGISTAVIREEIVFKQCICDVIIGGHDLDRFWRKAAFFTQPLTVRKPRV